MKYLNKNKTYKVKNFSVILNTQSKRNVQKYKVIKRILNKMAEIEKYWDKKLFFQAIGAPPGICQKLWEDFLEKAYGYYTAGYPLSELFDIWMENDAELGRYA